MEVSYHYQVPIFIIALVVSLMETKYNITEGTNLDIKIVASRAFSTDFKIHVITTLITATGNVVYMANLNIINCKIFQLLILI